jgi:hypothetical protein
MHSALDFFQSEHVTALIAALIIFLFTIFLVVKHWIGFWIAFLLLLFSLGAGVIINNPHIFQCDFTSHEPNPLKEDEPQKTFQNQMLQAMEDLRLEVHSEKENLRLLMQQLQEIFDSLDAQKQKLQTFIDETRERFKTEYPSTAPSKTTTSDSSLSATFPQ